jgi:hypothetical protein
LSDLLHQASPSAKNISLRDLVETPLVIPIVPALQRGVSRSSRTLGAGCGGRRGAKDVRVVRRTAKSCGPDAPTLASTRDNASHCAGMVTTSPVPRGARRKPLKPIAQGRPDRDRRTCGDYARMLFSFAYEAAGAPVAPGIPCALSGRQDYASTCAFRAAGRWRRICIQSSFRGGRKREPGIHFSSQFAARWIPGLRLEPAIGPRALARTRWAHPGMTEEDVANDATKTRRLMRSDVVRAARTGRRIRTCERDDERNHLFPR